MDPRDAPAKAGAPDDSALHPNAFFNMNIKGFLYSIFYIDVSLSRLLYGVENYFFYNSCNIGSIVSSYTT